MAVTAGKLNGTDLLVYDGVHALAHATDCTLQVSQSSRDASTKASAGWKSVLPGQRTWQVTTNGLVALDINYNYAYLMALWTNGTRIALKFKTANTDNFYFAGYAYLDSLTITAPNNNNATYSASFGGDDDLSLVSAGAPASMPTHNASWDIDGTESNILCNAGSGITGTLAAIASLGFDGITVMNEGAGTVSIVATGGLLIDGVATVYLATSQWITIFPNSTKFEAIGTYLTSPP